MKYEVREQSLRTTVEFDYLLWFLTLIWLDFQRRTAQSDAQYASIDFQRPSESRRAGVPSVEVAGGAEGDVHCSKTTAGAQGDDIQYACVQFKKAEIELKWVSLFL